MDIQRIFEALSSQVRRKILAYLAEAELTAGDQDACRPTLAALQALAR